MDGRGDQPNDGAGTRDSANAVSYLYPNWYGNFHQDTLCVYKIHLLTGGREGDLQREGVRRDRHV